MGIIQNGHIMWWMRMVPSRITLKEIEHYLLPITLSFLAALVLLFLFLQLLDILLQVLFFSFLYSFSFPEYFKQFDAMYLCLPSKRNDRGEDSIWCPRSPSCLYWKSWKSKKERHSELPDKCLFPTSRWFILSLECFYWRTIHLHFASRQQKAQNCIFWQ